MEQLLQFRLLLNGLIHATELDACVVFIQLLQVHHLPRILVNIS